MKKAIFLSIMLMIALSYTNAQEINKSIEQGLLQAWDIQVICTAPEGCTPPYKVTAFINGNSRDWITNNQGYVVANMDGMPAYDSEGKLLRYYIMATPLDSEIPCGLTDALYPTGSIYVEIEVKQGPCNMY